jgi:polysaccharide biosynthesis protein PslH
MRLLWLSPYPIWPRHHGGKLRTWALATGLAERGVQISFCFASDDPSEHPEVPNITWLRFPGNPILNRSDTLAAMLGGSPEAVRYAESPELHSFVRAHAPEVDAVVLEQAHMGAYARDVPSRVPIVVDAQNVESDLTRQIALSQTAWRHRWRGLADAAKFARHERRLLGKCSLLVTCSEIDRARLFDLGSVSWATVRPNGVDLDEYAFQVPPMGPPVVVMTGTLGYEPNRDAALWIAREIWPLVRRHRPDAVFRLVGAQAPPDVRELDSPADGIEVVGEVPEILPHLRQAQVFLMPLRLGSGTRLKGLQAMAAGCPVVSTSRGLEGLTGLSDAVALVRDEPDRLAIATVELLDDSDRRVRQAMTARRYVEERYSWTSIVADLHKDLRALTPESAR